MDHYLVEWYVPRRDEAALADAAIRARAASERLTSEGREVRYLWTIFLPADEICLHLYEAETADIVDAASRRAAVAYERIVRAISVEDAARRPTQQRNDERSQR